MDPAILVVDDNEDNRFTLSMRLEACGYAKLVMAENGREALAKLATQPFSLVLLDIMMPSSTATACSKPCGPTAG